MGALAAWMPVPHPVVERVYARGLFPALQPLLTGLSNLAPFALFDVVLVVGFAAVLVHVVGAACAPRRAGWLRAASQIVLHLAAVAAVSYLAFLVTWGLNYRRVPLEQKLALDSSRIRPEAALDLAHQAVDRINALHEGAHRSGWPSRDAIDPTLARAFASAQKDLGAPRHFVPGRPKRTLLDVYFRRAGVAGMTDPYFLETLVATDLLDVERPMVVAHEWSHLAGIADEGDANFAGWLACLRGGALHQYSGWLFLYGEIAGALHPSEVQRVSGRLAEGPRRDLQAIRERLLRHVSPRVAAAGWRVYDQYLKANRVEQGTASYAHVVRLILGATFTGDWTPRLRSQNWSR